MAAAAMALAKIERAHQMYRDGRHLEALESYTEVLSTAKTKAQKIALHSNRAACFLKIHDFRKAAEECTSVLELDHQHTGALMLRAQTLVTLKEYQSALFDVNRLIELNPSSEVYKNLQARLKTQLSLAPIPESEEETLIAEEELNEEKRKTDTEVPLTDRCSESLSGAVGCLGTNNEAESTQQELIHEEDNKFDGNTDHRSDETETAMLHTQETRTQNKNEPLTSIKEATRACRPDTDKHATVNTTEIPEPIGQQKVNHKEQKAVPQPIGQQKVSPKEQKAIPQPIGQQKANPQPVRPSRLDYSRWDQVDSDSSDEDDDDDDDEEEVQPRYRFRVRTFGVCPVK